MTNDEILAKIAVLDKQLRDVQLALRELWLEIRENTPSDNRTADKYK